MPHHETFHTTTDQQKLYLQGWEPEGERKAAVLLVHGLGEHSSRYTHVAEKFIANGIAVYTFDGRGHGKSSEPKPTAYFQRFEQYIEDIDALFGKMQSYVKDTPCFILGHSMGGGLVAYYTTFHQPKAKGIVLSGALLKPADDISPLLIRVSGLLSKITPKLQALKLDKTAISKDPAVVEAYDKDPLVYRKGVPARTGGELLKMMKGIQSNMDQFKLPVLIMHGTEDRLTNVEGSKMLHEQAASEDKTLKLYEGLYHEILNEPEQEQVIEDILQWIEKRL